MSEPILPLLEWTEGIPQARVPANDNALRVQALLSAAVNVSNDGSGAVNGDVFIVGSAPTGDFAAMSEHDIALYEFGSWYPWAPVAGVRMVVNDVRKLFNGTAWVDDPAGGGGSGAARTYTIVTEASAITATPATHSGLDTYNRCGGNVTFNAAQPYAAGQAYNIRATANLSLVGTGVTLTPPAGGTLDLETGMAVQVVMTSGTAGDVIGQTVPA